MSIIIVIILLFVFYFIINNRLNAVEQSLREIKKGELVLPTVPSVPTQAQAQSQTAQVPVHQFAAAPASHQLQQTTEESFGKTLGIIGVFAVLFGIGFFLKYAFDNNIIGITGRLLLGAAVGVLGIILGRLIKVKYESYSHVLSGGGIGVLFITAFTAHVFYDVISAPIAYILFGIITIVSIVLSIMDKKALLAAIGVAGGFLAPLLISFGNQNFISLFSYILIINIGTAIIAYFYRWMILRYIAFAGTLISVSVWTGRILTESDRYLMFSFATLYFFTFLATSVFHHIVRKENSNEGDLLFISLNALWYAAISYSVLNSLVHEFMGIFMAGLGILYLAVGYLSFTTHKEDKILNLSFPLIGVVFFTIAIPIQFDGSWITIAWIIEALCLCFIDFGIKGKRLYLYGIIIYMIGLFRLFVLDSALKGSPQDFMPVMNGRFALFVFAIVCGLLMAYIIKRASKELQEDVESIRQLPVFLGVITQVTTLSLLTTEINYYYDTQALLGHVLASAESQEDTIISIVWALYAAFLTTIGFVIHSKVFRLFGLALFVLTAFRVFGSLWALGPIYRIVTSIIFGVIALAASFLYARFKDRIKSWE